MADLKPCPFCSGPAYVSRSQHEPNAWIVGCRQYGAADPRMCAIAPASWPMISRAAAIAAWNVRPGSENFQRSKQRRFAVAAVGGALRPAYGDHARRHFLARCGGAGVGAFECRSKLKRGEL